MKKLIGVFLILAFAMAGCSTTATVQASTPEAIKPTVTLVPTVVPTATLMPTAIPTTIPTATATPVFTAERQKIQAIMEAYGNVDEKDLTDAYWQKLSDQISKYGEAKRILTLEYHGDNYNMYNGAYSMDPAEFETQMRYLLANDYHFVTGPELVGYLEGWLALPARSIILTSDSGAASNLSIPRISALFKGLEAQYGITPHMISFIWTASMDPKESNWCKNDACWQFFRDALNTGYFTFGTHTETHRDFSTLIDADTTWDLQTSMKAIHDNLGINVYGISWPFEACSTNPKLIANLGFKFALGGYSRDRNQLFTYANDNEPLCLPRLFPPNPDGLSGRPGGMTLEQMLDEAMNQYSPLN